MARELRSDLSFLARTLALFAAAAVAAGAVFYSLLVEIRQHGNIVEGGLVETVQLSVLAVTFAAFAVQAARDRETPRALAMVALSVLAMVVREMDGLFDRLTGDRAFWSYIDFVVLLAFLSVPALRFGRTVSQLARFAASPQCLLFVTGVVFSVVVAQLIGYKEIWNRIFDIEIWNDVRAAHVLEDGKLPGDIDIARHVKNTAEESIELGSYLMLLAAALLPPALRRKPAA